MILFAVLAVWAGFGLVTSGGNPTALTEAKSRFTNAFIGLLIVLSAWLLVDTLMRGLLGGEGEITGYGPWSEIACMTQSEATTVEGELEELERIEVEQSSIVLPNDDGSCPRNYIVTAPSGECVFQSAPAQPGIVGSNCGTDESALVSIPGQGNYRSVSATVDRFLSMQRQLAATGVSLNVTSAYRSDARQTQLWDECPTCQSQGTVARPCSRGGGGSAHTSGTALDLNSSGNRCEIIRACRSAGASFIMTYSRSGHVHCDWRGGGRRESLTISC